MHNPTSPLNVPLYRSLRTEIVNGYDNNQTFWPGVDEVIVSVTPIVEHLPIQHGYSSSGTSLTRFIILYGVLTSYDVHFQQRETNLNHQVSELRTERDRLQTELTESKRIPSELQNRLDSMVSTLANTEANLKATSECLSDTLDFIEETSQREAYERFQARRVMRREVGLEADSDEGFPF